MGSIRSGDGGGDNEIPDELDVGVSEWSGGVGSGRSRWLRISSPAPVDPPAGEDLGEDAVMGLKSGE